MLGYRWSTSSHSQPQGECVEAKRSEEVSVREAGEVLVRDSKDPEGGNLRVPGAAWKAFLAGL